MFSADSYHTCGQHHRSPLHMMVWVPLCWEGCVIPPLSGTSRRGSQRVWLSFDKASSPMIITSVSTILGSLLLSISVEVSPISSGIRYSPHTALSLSSIGSPFRYKQPDSLPPFPTVPIFSDTSVSTMKISLAASVALAILTKVAIARNCNGGLDYCGKTLSQIGAPLRRLSRFIC